MKVQKLLLTVALLAGAVALVPPADLTARRVTAGVLEYTTTPQQVVPSGGCTTVTPNASAFVSSNWFELIASTSTDIVLTGVAVNPAVDGGEWQLDVGVGAAASEVSYGEIARAQNVQE